MYNDRCILAQNNPVISLKVAFKVAWKPFDIQFGSRISKIRELREDIEREADIAHMTEAAASRSIVLANQAQLERLEKGGHTPSFPDCVI